MGNLVYYDRPDHVPESFVKPTFPPDYGFSGPRKVRESTVTEEEMKAMQVPLHLRDYCAHILREYYLCRKANAPIYGACKSYVHKYHECEWEDYIMRMKEYEREKRLRARQQKLEGQAVN